MLWGEYFYVNPRKDTADSQTAVHIVADPDAFSPGDYTFYGRYVGYDSRDDRAPLSSLYYARYLNGGAFSGGTDLVVWRDNREANVSGPELRHRARPGRRSASSSSSPSTRRRTPRRSRNSQRLPARHPEGPRGQATPSPSRESFGWLMIDLWHRDATHAQGWVGVIMSAEGRFSVSHAGGEGGRPL